MMAKATKASNLVAVVMADNFHSSGKGFANFALTPFCGNAVLLDYTLESLRLTEAKEVIITCAKMEKQIQMHVEKYWSSTTLPFKISVVPCSGSKSVGDVLRHLDQLRKLSDCGDFILLQAGAVFNSDLAGAVKEHKDRRKKDKNPVMTLVYRKCEPNHPTRSRLKDALFMINRDSGRIVHYQKLEPGVCCVRLPTELFEFDEENEVRLDLLDPEIAICSREIPLLFSDNFDDQTLDDLMKEILINEEILGNQIHAHVIEDAYAASVIDYHTYSAITKDVMARWSYPVVPDRIGYRAGSRMVHQRKNLYAEKGSRINRDVTLKQNVIVGTNSEIGQNALIENTVVGRNCFIGKNVTLKNCIFWDNVRIDDHATLDGCVVMSGSQIGKNVQIGARSVVREGAVVPSGVQLAPGSVVGEVPSPTVEDRGLRSDPSSTSLTPSDQQPCQRGDASLWPPWHPLCMAPQGSEAGDSESQESEEEEVEGLAFDDEEDEELRNFYGEVQETVKRCFDEKMNLEHVVLEINGSKHAYGINIEHVQDSIMKAVLEHALPSGAATPPAKEFWKTLKPMLTKLVPLFRKYCSGSPESEKIYLTTIQTFIESKRDLVDCLPNLLHHLYDKDALSETALLGWGDTLPLEAKDVSAKIKPFMDWLKADDDDDDDDSS